MRAGTRYISGSTFAPTHGVSATRSECVIARSRCVTGLAPLQFGRAQHDQLPETWRRAHQMKRFDVLLVPPAPDDPCRLARPGGADVLVT